MAFVPAAPSRSAIVTRMGCARLRLQAYDLDGTGYESALGSVATMSGIHIHEGFAALLDPFNPRTLEEAIAVMRAGYTEEIQRRGLRHIQGEDIDRVMREQLHMLECMLRGWAMVRMPLFLDENEVMSVERAWEWPLSAEIKLPLRMDLITRRREDGLLHIPDFKGCASGDSTWAEQFEYALQTALYLTALEETVQEPVGGMLYEGIVRGQFRKDTAESSPFYGKRIQYTTYCYAYRRVDPKTQEWEYRISYTNAKGWEKFFVGDVFTPEQWVNQLAEWNVLGELFIAGQPVNPPQRVRQAIRRQAAIGETAWRRDVIRFHALRTERGDDHPDVQEFLNTFAPQNAPGQCLKYGDDYRCAFYEGGLCFLANTLELLREDAAFKPRVSHHPGQESN